MAYTNYVTDGKVGIDLTATYASTSAGSTTLWPATPGTVVTGSNNSKFIFARAESDISQYDVVEFAAFGDSAISTDATVPAYIRAAPLLTAGIAAGGVAGGGAMLGFAQTSIASGTWGWIALQGNMLRVNCLVSCNPKVPLFSTSTAGKLDDATVSLGYIQGVTIITSATSASAPWAIVNNPGFVPYSST